MEKDDFGQDDFLRGLIQKIPLESPSDDFVGRIMAGIQTVPEIVPVQKPFYMYMESAAPYALLIFLLFVVFSTSDLPYLNWLPGKENYIHTIVAYFGSMFSALKNAFTSKYVSFGMLITVSAGFLYLIDLFFSRKASA